jgi:hypothetical protein
MLNRNDKLLYDLRTRKVPEFLQGVGNLKDKNASIGCGAGKFTSTLPSIVKDTLAIDYSKRAIRLSSARGVYYPIVRKFKDFPAIWRIFCKLILKTCAPSRSMHLIVKANAGDLSEKSENRTSK